MPAVRRRARCDSGTTHLGAGPIRHDGRPAGALAPADPLQLFRAPPARTEHEARRALGTKGALIVQVDSPIGRLAILAVHLYAGTRPEDGRRRRAQLARLLETLHAEADPGPILLAGDINVSPTVGFPEPPGPDNPFTSEYAALEGAGFIDPQPPNPTPAHRCVTWVPSRNRYAALPYQETKTDERYDYLMVRQGHAHTWEVKEARTVFDGPDAQLSDHFGVMVDLELGASVGGYYWPNTASGTSRRSESRSSPKDSN